MIIFRLAVVPASDWIDSFYSCSWLRRDILYVGYSAYVLSCPCLSMPRLDLRTNANLDIDHIHSELNIFTVQSMTPVANCTFPTQNTLNSHAQPPRYISDWFNFYSCRLTGEIKFKKQNPLKIIIINGFSNKIWILLPVYWIHRRDKRNSGEINTQIEHTHCINLFLSQIMALMPTPSGKASSAITSLCGST